MNLSEREVLRITVLQAASTFYRGGAGYVSTNMLAHFTGLSTRKVLDVVYFAAQQGFLETAPATPLAGFAPVLVRIDRQQWAINMKKISFFYAHYVSSAPSPQRGEDVFEQRPSPAGGCPTWQQRARPQCSTTIASNYNGVWGTDGDACCPVRDAGPVEVCGQYRRLAKCCNTLSENLWFMRGIAGFDFSLLLSTLYQQSPCGGVATSFADVADAAPADCMQARWLLAQDDGSIDLSHLAPSEYPGYVIASGPGMLSAGAELLNLRGETITILSANTLSLNIAGIKNLACYSDGGNSAGQTHLLKVGRFFPQA
jgi:hypothetical protein